MTWLRSYHSLHARADAIDLHTIIDARGGRLDPIEAEKRRAHARMLRDRALVTKAVGDRRNGPPNTGPTSSGYKPLGGTK